MIRKTMFFVVIVAFFVVHLCFAKMPFDIGKIQQQLNELKKQIHVETVKPSKQKEHKVETNSNDSKASVFGTTSENPFIFVGDVYFLPEGTRKLPDFRKLMPVGKIYTPILNIKPRHFDSGFPGITDRFEWFAIDYNGKAYISRSKTYKFCLLSDDGAKLLIDGRLAINNDGIHPPREKCSLVYLKRGLHNFEVQYFQGPKYYIALVLSVYRSGKKIPFDIRQYAPVVMSKKGCETELTLKSGILFAFNSYRLKPDAKRVLDSVLSMLENTNYDRIVVGGYTDDIGSKRYNLSLSEKRAKAVADYLISKGIPRNLVEVVGYGESRPLYPNDSEEHRALNRRVEIKIYSNCKNSGFKKQELDGVVEVYKGDVYIVVNSTCRCRQSYKVLGNHRDALKGYAGREVKVFGRIKKFSPWSGEIYVEKIY